MEKIAGKRLRPYLESLLGRVLFYLSDEVLLKGAAVGIGDKDQSEKDLSLAALVEKARIEWEQARNLFEEAQDPDLVEHAIYALQAAEKKYIYLLKTARKENICDEKLHFIQGSGLA